MFKTRSSGACAISTDRLVREIVLVGLVMTQIVTKKKRQDMISGTMSVIRNVSAGLMQGAFVF